MFEFGTRGAPNWCLGRHQRSLPVRLKQHTTFTEFLIYLQVNERDVAIAHIEPAKLPVPSGAPRTRKVTRHMIDLRSKY
jgi:hypothetical protein